MRKIFSAFILLSPILWGQWITLPQIPDIDDFIVDTLYVNMPHDSLDSDWHTGLRVQDTRDLDTTILDIQQTDKYKVIPVDQYIALDRPLAELFTERFARDSVDFNGTLKISRLSIWYDSSPVFAKGRRLNAYTILYNENKDPVSDWIWEISVDKMRKEKEADQLGRMVAKWLDLQSKAIQNRAFNRNLYPYLFRRQLMVWTEYILLPDGFALNGHLTLDYPPDQQRKWVRGSPGIYYRKGTHHESIAIGGLDQQWYRRIRTHWVLRFSTTGRFGFNNFDKEYYSYLDYWNIVFLNLASSVSLDYRPVYHKGVYGGVGFFNSFNILPLVIDRYEFGISFSVGVILP
ncbi:MAG: hypothetical protein GXO90_06140 [FCB group bacterium]|nr:hypothetical protein [FCB group bacterium]